MITGFELLISYVGSNRSTNCATTTSLLRKCLKYCDLPITDGTAKKVKDFILNAFKQNAVEMNPAKKTTSSLEALLMRPST